MLDYKGKNTRIIQATMIANKLLNGDKGFYAIVQGVDYLNTNTNSIKIVQCMKAIHVKYDINIKTYWKWNPFSSEMGYFTPERPLDINFNMWKDCGKKIEDYVESIIHEYVHAVDNQFSHLNFGHKFRWHPERDQSAPYKIGSIAKTLTEAHYVQRN